MNNTINQEVKFAKIGSTIYPSLVAIFVSLLLISNIGAVKLIQFGSFITDGGLFLFPLVYIVGDILSEVYGFKAAKRAVYLAFAMAILASITFWLVQVSPPAADWPNQESFEAVLGFVPRIVLASISAFFVGQLLNAYVLVKIKERTKEKSLWARLMGSTLAGQFVDTLIFCTIAFYGVINGATFISYVAFGFLYKTLVEFTLVPVTYQVIRLVKKYEPSYQASE